MRFRDSALQLERCLPWLRHTQCDICGEEYRSAELLDFTRGLACWSCMTSWIRVRLDDANPRVRCPFAGCSHPLDLQRLQDVLHSCPALQLQWEKLMLEEGLGGISNLFRCPTPGCENAVVLPPHKPKPAVSTFDRRYLLEPLRHRSTLGHPIKSSAIQKFACTQCKREYCTACSAPWSVGAVSHENASCRAVRDACLKQQGMSRTRERRSERWKAIHTRSCPACNTPIERSAGCDHMTCAVCHHEFCWRCGGIYFRDLQGLRCMHRPPCVPAPVRRLRLFQLV